jgi:MATE family multidrug resistance protein
MTPQSILTNFGQISLHQKILFIALPMIISNITTPLMGLVDTAVLGHMSGLHFIAGASVASLIITQLYWLCGFVRMSSTGLSAQAKGSNSLLLKNQSLFQSLLISIILGALLLLLHKPILGLGLYFAGPEPLVKEVMLEYFFTRIWGAPAALGNLALIGWLIGQQKTKQVLIIQILANVLNVILNVAFVYGLGLEVFGVALASVLAEYFIFLSSFVVALKALGKPFVLRQWFSFKQLRPLLSLNGNTFVRNLILQCCIGFLVFTGVGFGPTDAAINAILMQFFTLIALGLDGVAYAAEALVGEQKGRNDHAKILQVSLHGLVWSGVVALLYCAIFAIFGAQITAVLTDQVSLQTAMQDYIIVVLWLPIVAHWCFFFDGVFVGLTKAKAMRNSMLVSAVLFYFPVFWLLAAYQNQALWMALLVFMLARGISLAGYFTYLCRTQKLGA